MVDTSEDIKQWRNDIEVYNEEYETLYASIKSQASDAMKFLNGKIPFPDTAESATKLSFSNAKLVDIQAVAVQQFRGATKFYETTRARIIENLVEEKKIDVELAKVKAETLLTEEFELLDEAEYNFERATKLWQSTDTLIKSLHLRL